MLWKASLERCACQMDNKFDLSSLCVLSEGYSAAAIDQVMSAGHMCTLQIYCTCRGWCGGLMA